MPRRRIILATVVLLLLTGIVTVVWTMCDWPPPRLILKYGLPPAGGPTGRSLTLAMGPEPDEYGEPERIEIAFVELRPGYARSDRHPQWCEEGGLISRVLAAFGLSPRGEAGHLHERCRYWAEVPRTVWISREAVGSGDLSSAAEGLVSRDADEITMATALSRRAPGTLRLATLREWDYAILTGAIGVEPMTLEEGQTESETPRPEDLSRPDEGPVSSYFGMMYYRLVWIPSEDED